MATNERVSQLLELFATDIQSEDLLLITDMSQRESKKVEIGQLLLFIENSGSFEAFNAAHADTASFILAQNINGTVAVSQIASSSISSSFSSVAVSSSNAVTASFALVAGISLTNTTLADTASFLQYSGTPNGTASYAVNANTSNTSTTAFNLFFNGQPNGTASWAVNSSNANSASTTISSSITQRALQANTASFISTASFAKIAGNVIPAAPIRATGQVSWSLGASLPQLYNSFNISNFFWLGKVTSGTSDWNKFGIVFTNPMPTTNYIYLGHGAAAYYNSGVPNESQMNPTDARYTTGCTCSIQTTTGSNSNLFYVTGELSFIIVSMS